MNSKQHRTLEAVFDVPTRADVRWPDVESLLAALGADISEGRGSGLCVRLNGVTAVFQRPHPKRIAGKGMVDSVRMFLTNARIEP